MAGEILEKSAQRLGEATESVGRNVIAVIGIDRYRHWRQLANAVHDATGTSAMFRRLGFEEITAPLLDDQATGKAILSLVTDDLNALGPDDSLLLFYAGHGGTRMHHVGDKMIKTGYLIPVDAWDSPDKVSTWIDLEAWLRAVSLLPAKHVLVVIDACHSGIALDPILKWRDIGSGHGAPLSTLKARRSRRIITSALDDQVALDSGPVYGHSLFTGCLIEGLTHGVRRGGGETITGSELGLYVQRRVETYPSSRQTPDFGAFGLDDRGEMVIPLMIDCTADPAAVVALSNPKHSDYDLDPSDDGNMEVEADQGFPATTGRDQTPMSGPLSTASPTPRLPPTPAAGSGGTGPPRPEHPARASARSDSASPQRSALRRFASLAMALLVLAVLAAVGLAVWRYPQRPSTPPSERAIRQAGTALSDADKRQPTPPAIGSAIAPIDHKEPGKIFIGVNDFGGAYPGIVANDGMVAGANSRFAKAGLDVEFRLIKDPKQRLEAFDKDEVHIVLISLDYLAHLVPSYREKSVEIKTFLMIDWSRGNLGIVATPRITSVEGLVDARVATTKETPSHYLLLTLLGKSNLTVEQVEKVKSNIQQASQTAEASKMFQNGQVDAAVVWEPYLSQSVEPGKGHVLISTATASNLVVDMLFARDSFLKAHDAQMTAFTRIWFEGVAQIEKDPESSQQIIDKAFQQSRDKTVNVMKKIKLTNLTENREFFGFGTEQAQYLALFRDASQLWQKAHLITTQADGASARWLRPLEALTWMEHPAARLDDHSANKPSGSLRDGPKLGMAVITRGKQIYFKSNEFKLDPNAKRLVDEFVEGDLAGFRDAAYVRVVGHTDSVGTAQINKWLSEKRALAVVNYLVAQHHFDPAHLQAFGNGSDTAGDDGTEQGRERNRRTDFEILSNE